ncbi:MAG: hypothetical protein ACYCQI_05020 [Gammaproteobacteria bacterium]
MLNREPQTDKYFSDIIQEILAEREEEERACAERFEQEELESLKRKSLQEQKKESEVLYLLTNASSLSYGKEMTHLLLQIKEARLCLWFIKNWLNARHSPSECIDYYNAILPIIRQSELQEFESYINKLVKIRILTIALETKEIAKTFTTPLEESFLNERRPSKYRLFTQLFDTSSKKIYDKIKNKKLDEAKLDLVSKQEKNEKILEEQLRKKYGP